MEVDRAANLLHYTYYMLDWSKVAQAPSGDRCLACGGPMASVEAVDREGLRYEGTVCHRCKRLLWLKK